MNANSRNYGTFAVVYHRKAIPAILAWIEETSRPFDHMLSDLTAEGVSVRVAMPFVAIQDVRHPSQIDPDRTEQENFGTRAAKHHWEMQRFCATDGSRLRPAEAPGSRLPSGNQPGSQPGQVDQNAQE